jgi:sensor histidine kinase regulating citrate/malate metabolism
VEDNTPQGTIFSVYLPKEKWRNLHLNSI